jgi:hypothetical protein
MALRCLHCEISELMQRRQAQGERVAPDVIGKLCEVIADIAASDPAAANNVFRYARSYLDHFECKIAAGTYGDGGELVTRQSRGYP